MSPNGEKKCGGGGGGRGREALGYLGLYYILGGEKYSEMNPKLNWEPAEAAEDKGVV